MEREQARRSIGAAALERPSGKASITPSASPGVAAGDLVADGASAPSRVAPAGPESPGGTFAPDGGKADDQTDEVVAAAASAGVPVAFVAARKLARVRVEKDNLITEIAAARNRENAATERAVKAEKRVAQWNEDAERLFQAKIQPILDRQDKYVKDQSDQMLKEVRGFIEIGRKALAEMEGQQPSAPGAGGPPPLPPPNQRGLCMVDDGGSGPPTRASTQAS